MVSGTGSLEDFTLAGVNCNPPPLVISVSFPVRGYSTIGLAIVGMK
jgi:hypothetical protein